MPMYLDQPVSDDYLQGLIGAYRDGQRAIGGDEAVEDGDAAIQARLEELGITKELGAEIAGRFDTTASS